MHLRKRCILLHLDGISLRIISSNVSFKTHVSILILYFDDLSISVSGVLKSPTIIVLLSISLFMSVSVCFMYWGAPYVRCIDIYNCYIFLLDWSLDHYVVSFLISCNLLYFKVYLSDMRIATPQFFCFPFAWNIFFHLLTICLFVSLGLKWVSCRQHIWVYFVLSIQPVCFFWLEHLIHLHLN